jgi:hypothetical protein
VKIERATIARRHFDAGLAKTVRRRRFYSLRPYFTPDSAEEAFDARLRRI